MSTLPTPPHKDTYKIRNWKAYNRSLCNRGRLTLWINDSVLNEWEKASQKQKIVGEQTYCDSIIQCCLLLKINYGLKLRQSTGFVESLFTLMGKSHLPVDLDTQEILSVELTGNDEDDASVGANMLKDKTNNIKRFAGDGAYDKFGFREVLGSDILQIIPPPKNAVIQKGSKKTPLPDYLIQRNRAVEEINKHGSKRWKQENGYHRRSLNEVAMFRYKTIFGGELDARTLKNQTTEVKLKCLMLNKFIGTGMPDAYKVS